MNKVVKLVSVRQERKVSLEDAWQRFIDAHVLAQKTLRIEDGIRASKAYYEFIELCGRPGNG